MKWRDKPDDWHKKEPTAEEGKVNFHFRDDVTITLRDRLKQLNQAFAEFWRKK